MTCFTNDFIFLLPLAAPISCMGRGGRPGGFFDAALRWCHFLAVQRYYRRLPGATLKVQGVEGEKAGYLSVINVP